MEAALESKSLAFFFPAIRFAVEDIRSLLELEIYWRLRIFIDVFVAIGQLVFLAPVVTIPKVVPAFPLHGLTKFWHFTHLFFNENI